MNEFFGYVAAALGRKPYALSWALAFLAATLQWTGNVFAPSFPNPESHWLTVNALALVFITLGLRGHCQRAECKFLPQNLWPYSGAVFAVIAWATVVEPHVGVRTTLVPASGMVALLVSAAVVLQHRTRYTTLYAHLNGKLYFLLPEVPAGPEKNIGIGP